MTDNTQELDDILFEAIESAGSYIHKLTATEADYIQEQAKEAILAIIRTEKLKLLAEVKERVVQSLPDTAFHGTSIRVKENIRDGGYHDGVLDSRLATEETLTKLEAEL